MVYEVSILGHLTHRRLQGDSVEPQAFAPAFPPMSLSFQHFCIFCFWNAIALARFDQHLPIDRPIIDHRRELFRYRTSTAVGCVSTRPKRTHSASRNNPFCALEPDK